MPTSGSRGAVQFWCFCCRVSCLLDSSSIWLQVLGQHSQHRGLLGGQKMFVVVVVVVVASIERKIETPASFSWLTISASMWMSYLQSLGKRLIQSMTRMDKPKFLVDMKKGRKNCITAFFCCLQFKRCAWTWGHSKYRDSGIWTRRQDTSVVIRCWRCPQACDEGASLWKSSFLTFWDYPRMGMQ